MPLSDALKLAIKVLNKTLDVTKLTKEKGAVSSSHINFDTCNKPGTLKPYYTSNILSNVL